MLGLPLSSKAKPDANTAVMRVAQNATDNACVPKKPTKIRMGPMLVANPCRVVSAPARNSLGQWAGHPRAFVVKPSPQSALRGLGLNRQPSAVTLDEQVLLKRVQPKRFARLQATLGHNRFHFDACATVFALYRTGIH